MDLRATAERPVLSDDVESLQGTDVFGEKDPCPFYGVRLLSIGTDQRQIVATKGRIFQCGLFTVLYTACVMHGEHGGPRWKACPINPANTKRG